MTHRIETLATVLLAVAAVATAWSGYQATRWNGEQAKASGTTNKIRIEAARAQGLAQAQTLVDVATFTQWVDAYAHEDRQLEDFYFKRFRKEFRPAVEAWLATRPLKNPNAPLTPFAMPQYRLAATAEANRLDAEAELSAATVRRNIQRSSNYILGVVLFSVSLFFADSGERAVSQAMLVGSATAVVTATLLAIHALDNPYRPGVGSLRPVAMQRSLVLLDKGRDVVNDTTPLPCDEQGAPL